MTTTTQPPGLLPGSLRNHGPLRACGRCDRTSVPEGGVQLNPTRWVCSGCWMSCTAGNNPTRKRLLGSIKATTP